jgi:hypothetical protein
VLQPFATYHRPPLYISDVPFCSHQRLFATAQSTPPHTNHQFTSTHPLHAHLARTAMCAQALILCYIIALRPGYPFPFQCLISRQAYRHTISFLSSTNANLRVPLCQTSYHGQKMGLLNLVLTCVHFFVSLFSTYVLGYLMRERALNGLLGTGNHTSH